MRRKRTGERREKKSRKRREEEEARPHMRPADPIHPLSSTSHPSHHLPLAGRRHKEREGLRTRPKHRVLAGGGGGGGRQRSLSLLSRTAQEAQPPHLAARPRGTGDSLYLEPVPCSQPPHSCQGESRHIPAPSTTTQPGRAMLSAFIQLMQQSIQEKKKMKP